MQKSNQAHYEEITWREIKGEVRRENPEFAQIIDDLKNKHPYPLYRVRYPFGSTIIDKGKYYFPLQDGTLVPVTDPAIPNEIRKNLDYHLGSIPLGMVLKHSVELFMQTEERVIPYSLIKPGYLFGLWAALSVAQVYMQVWHMTAGARSIFVLPKITDTASHKKLCRARDIKMPLTRHLGTHWSLLTKMAQHPDFSMPWHTEILLFSKQWLKPQKNDSWLRFQHFLYQSAWPGLEFWRRKVIYDHIWDKIIREFTQHDIRAMPFIIEIVKHIVMIGLGTLPGFSPAIDNFAAPIDGLQEDFVKLYGLKHYAPTMMVPHHFSLNDRRPVYWSLMMPTHFESTLKPKTLMSTLEILREIRELILYFKETLLKSDVHIVDDTLDIFLKELHFDFFHSEPDNDGKIRLSLEMPKEDSSLIYCASRLGRRHFSDVSPFVRGCIRFSSGISNVKKL